MSRAREAAIHAADQDVRAAEERLRQAQQNVQATQQRLNEARMDGQDLDFFEETLDMIEQSVRSQELRVRWATEDRQWAEQDRSQRDISSRRRTREPRVAAANGAESLNAAIHQTRDIQSSIRSTLEARPRRRETSNFPRDAPRATASRHDTNLAPPSMHDEPMRGHTARRARRRSRSEQSVREALAHHTLGSRGSGRRR